MSSGNGEGVDVVGAKTYDISIPITKKVNNNTNTNTNTNETSSSAQ